MSALQPKSFLRNFRRAAGAVLVVAAIGLCVSACNQSGPDSAPVLGKPAILFITLDTTRADSIGPSAIGVSTPAFNAIAARGRNFQQAYAAIPETLPSHTSMFSGVYPAAHGIHENGRVVGESTPLVAADLKASGYRTAAFVSSFALVARSGLARGFESYDDEVPAGQAERTASDTVDRALAGLQKNDGRPLFMWVHFNEPHLPYAPPEPFRTQFAKAPYLGEIAAMDREIGRLVSAFEAHAKRPVAIIIAGDHGEGLGEHGERDHGHLLYQSTMHVPLVVVGPEVAPGGVTDPVSSRRVAFTILDFAGATGGVGTAAQVKAHTLRTASPDVVLGEAMKPFLEYGWQPQVMAVAGRHKAILSGRVEGYDLVADPGEKKDIAAGPALPTNVRNAVYDYPVPVPGAPGPGSLNAADREKLASLGYVSGGPTPVIRKNAPRAADMLSTLDLIVDSWRLFGGGRYAEVLPILQRILAADPHNLASTLQLATTHSMLGHRADADRAFARAEELAPESADVAYYRSLHIGRFAMAAGDTPVAIAAFERARGIRRDAFRSDLELGVLYLASRRLAEARDALDRVEPASAAYAMALFKRAQVSVLLGEPDAPARIQRARDRADAVTGPLIAREKLFAGK